jgi:hypothetical protein
MFTRSEEKQKVATKLWRAYDFSPSNTMLNQTTEIHGCKRRVWGRGYPCEDVLPVSFK